jgi:hypothetical protein
MPQEFRDHTGTLIVTMERDEDSNPVLVLPPGTAAFIDHDEHGRVRLRMVLVN